MPINRSLSRLMTAGHIDAFDALEAVFLRIERGLPQLWARPEMAALWVRLLTLKGKMEQPRYYVGFLGRSQVGKSSTLNSILKAPKDQGPGTGGAGAPMTSNVTRLHRLEPSEGQGHAVSLRFMTPDQFRQRRGVLAKNLGYNPLEQSDDAILVNLDELIHREAQSPDDESRPTGAKTEDRRYLARLLRSYRAFPQLVVEPARVVEGEYAKRKEYTNHPSEQEPWPYLLLSQVEIGYRTESISPKIELIDLPGLGARMVADDELTEAFLPQLDGALVFQSSEQVAAKEAYTLLEKLSERFRRMEGRTWMVFTRFDGLTDNHYGATADSINILDNISKTLGDNKVPHEQVLFVGNEFHKKLQDGDGRVRKPSPELLKAALDLDCDDSGQPIIPEGFKKHPVLCEAFKKVTVDGGIENIREVIGEQLAALVEAEVREAVESELGALKAALRRLVRSTEESSQLNSNGFKRAVLWKTKLQGAQQALDLDRRVIEGPTKEAVAKLQEEFRKDLLPDGYTLTKVKLRTSHKEYATVLDDSATLEYKTEVVPKVYGWVTERLRQAHAILGDLRFNGHISPLKAWEELKDRDLENLDWLKPILAFNQPPLFPPDERDVHLNDTQYRQVILRKVETLCHRAALRVQERVKGHLEDLERNLAMIQSAEDHVDTAATALFQELLKALA